MTPYQRAIQLLKQVSSEKGFLASANDITNYHRVWARDGIICGLAAIMDGDQGLIDTFKATLITLADHQHPLGNIPSNVFFDKPKTLLSFGGLAGRVDTISWFVIGLCYYAYRSGDISFAKEHLQHMHRGLRLLDIWEFNHAHLLYVPRSGNWADEYITEGYILYDQLLRLWALRCYRQLFPNDEVERKIKRVARTVRENYRKQKMKNEPYHPKAFKQLKKKKYWMASFGPAGYQTQYDALANALGLLLQLDEDFSEEVIFFSEGLRQDLQLKLLPAFWPPIMPEDKDWELLENNCKYTFRNIPYEFHNGGTWQMVNGFYGMALAQKGRMVTAKEVLDRINDLNSREDWGLYENFNTQTGAPTGVPHCAWSAAGAVLLRKTLEGERLLI